MSEFFAITDEGTAEQVARRLELGAQRANELFPVLAKIAENMFAIEEAVFHSGGRRGGGSWKPLKESTVRRKGGDHRILIRTGELKASLTEPGHRNNILEITNNALLFGTSDELAVYHTEGAGGLPRRPVIKFAPYDYKRWNNWIARFLVDGV